MKAYEKKAVDRLADLVPVYGSRKALAESIGVSTRTLRRWINEKAAVPESRRAEVTKKVSRREHYYQVEVPKREARLREEKPFKGFTPKPGELLEPEPDDPTEARPLILDADRGDRMMFLASVETEIDMAGLRRQVEESIRKAGGLTIRVDRLNEDDVQVRRTVRFYPGRSIRDVMAGIWADLRRVFRVEGSKGAALFVSGIY